VTEPNRHSVLGALIGLTVAENQGDVMDEVFIICDALGISRPEYNEEREVYLFPWEEE
jgi:hypothetical protein